MTSNSSPDIPSEIIHKIINELRDDIHTLQNTSLVAHPFLHPSQQTLFSKITISLYGSGNPSLNTQKLVSILGANVELASYVRDLILTIEDTHTPDTNSTTGGESEALSTLSMLQNIRKLSLHHFPSWTHIDIALRHTILGLCALPRLNNLSLTDTQDFPIDHLAPHLPRLTDLTLTNVDLTQGKVGGLSLPERDRYPDIVEGKLKVVAFDCVTARSSLTKLFISLTSPQSKLKVTDLRALKISGYGPYFEESMAIEKIMGFVAEKLECLIWGTLDEVSVHRLYSSWISYQPRLDTGAINLAALIILRCFAVSFALNLSSGGFTANTTWITNSLEAIKGNNRLEEIILVLYPNQIAGTAPDMVEWTSKLDLLLLEDGFKTLSKVSVYLATPHFHEFLPETERIIVEHMHTLHALGILNVERLNHWDDAQEIYDDAIARSLYAGW